MLSLVPIITNICRRLFSERDGEPLGYAANKHLLLPTRGSFTHAIDAAAGLDRYF
jgi:hypothetical protein